jgi:drug/metabolite transporter (DMT)-like permease
VPQSNDADQTAGPRTNHVVTGAMWMLFSCCFIAGISVLARYAAKAGVPPMQIVFLRLLFALITMLPLLLWRGRSMITTNRWTLYLVRVCTGLSAMVTWFIAVALEPVGKITAISFMAPVFATVLAVMFLGEVVHVRRWAATLTGFVGALIVLRPGILELTPGVWLALISAMFMGLSTTLIKRLTASDDPNRIVFITTLIMTPLTLLPALWVWHWPTLHVWLVLLAPARNIHRGARLSRRALFSPRII